MVNNLTINNKLKVNLGIVVVGLIILGFNVYFSLSNINKEYHQSNILSTKTSDLKSILIGGLLYNSASGVVKQDPTKQKAKDTMKSGYEKVNEFFIKLQKESDTTCGNISSEVREFISVAKTLHLKAVSNQALTKDDMKKSLATWRALKFKIQPQLKKIKKELMNSQKKYKELLDSMLLYMLINIVIIAVIMMVLSILIGNSIKQPIQRLTDSMLALMKFGSADQKVQITSKDEIGTLAKHFNDYMQKQRNTMAKDLQVVEEVDKAIQMARAGFFVYTVKATSDNRATNDLKKSVNDMIQDLGLKFDQIDKALIEYGNAKFDYKFEVDNVSGTIGSMVYGTKAIGSNISELLATIMLSSEQLTKNIDVLSTSSNSLATSANAQAVSLEETAAAVEEISSNIQSSSENVNKMASLSDEVTSSADQGQVLASKTARSMDDINEQVIAINEAISVIDQISFQTNILSLNAAVEAATAGEAGKGFAVVAQEVRNLASRSAEAANEIKSLVENAAGKANEGKEVADQMISGYTSLSEKISQNKQMIDTVLEASKEQTKGIVQINDSINILDKNTQENAADASNIDALAAEVTQLAKKLMDISNKASYREEAKSQICDVDMAYKLNKLKLDHLKFKTNSFVKLNERSSFKVVSHNECALAKWIKEQELENKQFTKTNNWKELNEAHKLVHQNVQKYIDKNAQNDSNEHLLSIGNEIEEATGKVFRALNIVKQENCKD